MSKKARLVRYLALMEGFLNGTSTPVQFASEFFERFKNDPEMWEGELYEALNAVATASEGYTPGPPISKFDVTEQELRGDVKKGVEEVRRALAGGT